MAESNRLSIFTKDLCHRQHLLTEMEPRVGLEPTTSALQGQHSTAELPRHKVVVSAGLEPAHGTNLVRFAYKTNGATLHYETVSWCSRQGSDLH